MLLDRRDLLELVVRAAALPGAARFFGAWFDAAAHGQTHRAMAPPEPPLLRDYKPQFFDADDFAALEAFAAILIPTDDTPGAREAGVVYFIDRSLASFFSQLAGDYRAQLAAFQGAFRLRHPSAGSFASLPSERQIEYLTTVDQTPFFKTTRLFTILGMLSLPAYGGNRNGVGWKLLGFEDAHAFAAPFGHYDRAYPGFVIDPVTVK